MLIGSQHPAFNVRSEVDINGNLYIGSFAATPSGAIFAKIDTNGNLLFTNTSTVNSPLGFRSMRLKGNYVVMATGSSVTEVAPVYVWDTTGTLLWTAAATGNGSFDVEIDDSDNIYAISYLTNAVSPTSGDDITMTKFNSSGTQLWKKDYHLGGSEFPTRFTYSNGRLSGIGWGPSTPAAYFDWKIFQVDTEGTLLWNATYDGTPSNDEHPYFITAKPNGEVIVTGKGGPSPDPNNSSYLQMVIVQYSNTGTQDWIDMPNMYGGWGMACMLASDNSLYAISSSNMTAYHYNQAQITNVKDLHKSVDVQIFPNPFMDKITVMTPKTDDRATALIYDNSGKLLFSFKLTGEHTVIDLTELKSGFYFCRITSDNFSQTVRLVKR